MTTPLYRVELFDVDYPTKDGLVHSRRVVNNIVHNIKDAVAQGRVRSVLSQFDPNVGQREDDVIGGIYDAAIEDDKLVIYVDFDSPTGSGLLVGSISYEWKVHGMAWFSEAYQDMPHVLGYKGPPLKKAVPGFIPHAFVRKEIRKEFKNFFYYTASCA